MKKLIIPAAIAVAAITSCQNGALDVPEEQGSFSINAGIESLVDTKSSVTDEGVFSWIKGDGIAVYDGSAFLSYYAQAAGATATFTGEESSSLQSVAVSPVGLKPSYSESVLKVTLPASYKWVENQTSAPMISEFDDISKGLTFKYLGGIVKIQLKNVPANATKFVFTTSKDITGEYTVSEQDSEKIIASKGNTTKNEVTFTFDAGSDVRNMDFYIPVPVGEYTFAMGVYQEDGTPILTKTSTKNHSISRKSLLIINPISVGSASGSGESGRVTSLIPSSHKGTFYLPSTTSTVDLTVEANTNAVEVVYAYGGEKPANVNVLCGGDVADLTITLPESHVELSGTSESVVSIASLASSTSASTLVLANTVKVSALTITKGSATIGCEVKTVTVEESTTIGDAPVIEVSQTGKVTESLVNNNASAVIIAVNGFASDGQEAGDGQIKAASGENVYTPGEYLVKYLGKNGTAVLDKDLEGDIVIEDGTVLTVDLNGHKITNVKGDTFTVEKGASLTITGEGTVDNITHAKACIYNNGTLILNGGTYTRSAEAGTSTSTSTSGGNSYYNILNHGTMTIAEGVTISSTGSFSSLIDNGYYNYGKSDPRVGYVEGTNEAAPSLTINGGSFTGGVNTVKNDDGATLVINGGTFTNTTQACIQNNNVATINDGTFNHTEAVAVQSIYYNDTYNLGKTTINGGTFNGYLVSRKGGTFVFGDKFTNTKVYVDDEKSLVAALVSATVKTIVLNNDIALSDKLVINIDRNLVIDLNEKTLSGRTNLTKGNVTFKNGTIAGGAEQALNVYGSPESSASKYSVLTIDKTVKVTADVWAVCIFGATATTEGYGVEVYLRGTIETEGNGKEGAIFVSGNLGKNEENFAVSNTNKVYIYGTVTSQTDAAVALNGAASVFVSDKSAKLTGNTGVAIKRGKLTVSNGTITGNGAAKSSPDANNDGAEMSGSAVYASDTYSNYGPLSVELKGGTFTSAAYTILNNSSCDFKISGGTFSSTLADDAIAVWARRGNINIIGGTFETSSNNEATLYVGTNANNLNGNTPKLTVSGSSTVVKNTATGSYKYNSALAPLAVNMYNALDYKAVEISSGTFYGNNPSKDDAVTGDNGNFLADGYSVCEVDGAYVICPAGEEEVFKLKTQLSVKNATVEVSEDVTLSNVLSATGANTTLVLADGAVITGNGQSSGSAREAIQTSNGLTLKGNGTIKSDISTDATKSSVLRVGGGTVNIEDGVTLEAGSGNDANYAVRIVKGTVNIKGGYFHSSNTGTCELIYLESAYATSSKCYLNISGGVFECDGDASYMINCYDSYRSKCTVSITGGIFVGFNPADNIAEGEHTNFCADGYTTEETTYNGKKAWKVVKESAE